MLMDAAKIIENIQDVCERRGLKTTNACSESGAGKDLIANLRKGVIPSVEKIAQLAAYLGVTTSELLGEAPPQRDGERQVKDDDIKAAFWGGEKDLSPEEVDALWEDVKAYKKFVTERKLTEQNRKEK